MENLTGSQPEQVIDLLLRRAGQGAHAATDGRKVGLIVEGGGMRGVLSAGSLLAIDLLGLRGAFDVVYAVSAGSVNAAYFLSGQGALGITVYFDDISSRRFINPWRIWKAVDVDYVYDYLVCELKPLDEEAVRASDAQFFVTATDVDTGENVLLDAKNSSAPVSRYLKASSALPVLYNRTVPIGNHRYMDGGASGGLPVDWAVKHGCTDLLNLLSRPISHIGHVPKMPERLIYRAAVGLRYPAMYQSFLEASARKERNRRMAIGIDKIDGVNVATIAVSKTEGGVDRTTIDRRLLISGAYESAASTFKIFGAKLDLLNETFRSFGWFPN